MVNTDVKVFLNNEICPLCRRRNVVVINLFGEGYKYRCCCSDCGLEQYAMYDCAQEAIDAWNRGEI